MAEDDGGTKAQRRAIPTADFGLGRHNGSVLVRSRVLAENGATTNWALGIGMTGEGK